MLKSRCYVSTATELPSDAQLEDLLRQARKNNDTDGITGVLLYCKGTFMQYVEGPPPAIDALWERLARDRRHHGVIELFDEPRAERIFDGWSMAFRTADAGQIDALVQLAGQPEPASRRSATIISVLRSFWRDNR